MKYFFALAGIVLLGAAFATDARAQRRDFLTDEEVEIVREAQRIDDRIAVLVHAIDRRLAVLSITAASDTLTKPYKEKGEWGAAPAGSRIELLTDIKKLLQKAVDDIDNLAARPDSAWSDPDEKKPVAPKDLFNKAVRELGNAARRYKPVFDNELARTEDRAEKGVFLNLIDNCEQIIAAVEKIPAAPQKSKN